LRKPAVRVAKITIETIKRDQQKALARPCPDWDALAPLFPVLRKGRRRQTAQSSAWEKSKRVPRLAIQYKKISAGFAISFGGRGNRLDGQRRNHFGDQT